MVSLATLGNILVGIQAATFFLLFPVLLATGNWNLALAQLLLGFVTILVYFVGVA